MNYQDFLKTKVAAAPNSGFEIDKSDIHPALLPHQRDAVLWAVRGGRRALFESFGLGKTIQELEFCRIVAEHPFAGLFSVPFMAVKMERRGWGCELNTDYFRDGVGYLQEAESKRDVPTLFDFTNQEAGA